MKCFLSLFFACALAGLFACSREVACADEQKGIPAAAAALHEGNGVVVYVPLDAKLTPSSKAKIQVWLSPNWKEVLSVEDAELLEGWPRLPKLAVAQAYFYDQKPDDVAAQFLLVDMARDNYTLAVYLKGLDQAANLQAAKESLPGNPSAFHVRVRTSRGDSNP